MRCTSILITALLYLAAPNPTFPLAGGHSREGISWSPAWPSGLKELLESGNRVNGYFVNANDFFFYQGDAKSFNEFVERYAKLKDTPHAVVLHPGQGMTGGIGEPPRIPYDWQVSSLRRRWDKRAPADSATTYTVTVDVYVGGDVRLSEIKIPADVEVRSGGEIERFVKEHEARRAAMQGGQARATSAETTPTLLAEPQKLGDDPFAIYLLQDPSVTGTAAEKMDLERIPLAPKPLLTTDDFTSYSWSTHRFGLTPEAVKTIPPVKSVWGVPFVVVSHGKRLYLGAFWTSLSSASFPHPVIDVFEARLPSAGWRIARAYPGTGGGEAQEDPRVNPAIKEAFEKAGKLTP